MTLALRAPRRLLTAALAVIALTAGITVATPAPPAHAAASVSISVEGRPDLTNVADPTYLTQLRVSGSGFQSIQNGFGGIYVAFGWVSDGWQPSQGGATGTDYRYVPDDESNPTGYVNFVAFPGSSTGYAANGGEIAADGTWTAVMQVPGATFTSLDRNGTPTEVNCLDVQCGIITIGAHGVINPSNETFTPVSFRDLYSEGDPEAVPVAPDAAATAPTPAPTQTVYETQAPVALDDTAASDDAAASDEDELLSILLWAVVGVGILAVLAVAFLVWAVLSARKRQRTADAAASGPAETPADSGSGS